MPYPNILSRKDDDFHIFSHYGRQVGQRDVLGLRSQKISRVDWHGGRGGLGVGELSEQRPLKADSQGHGDIVRTVSSFCG